jgi:hypothetical protein
MAHSVLFKAPRSGLRLAFAATIGIGVMLAGEAQAAISAGCNFLNAGLFNATVVLAPSFRNVDRVFKRGDRIRIVWTDVDGMFFDVDGNPVVGIPSGNPSPISGSDSFTVPGDGPLNLIHSVFPFPRTSGDAVFTCIPAPEEPVEPQAPTQQHMGSVFFPYVLTQFNPESMPGTIAIQTGGGDDSFSSLQNFLPSTSPAASTPWPTAASAYGPEGQSVQNISTGGERAMTLGGIPVTGWFRAKGFLYDGAFNTRGGAGQFMGGAVFGVTDAVDIGVFGQIAASEIKSVPLSGELDSVLGGVGGYAKIDLPERMRAGLSVVHTWGDHDIIVGGASGAFDSRHWTLEGSLARPYDLSGFVVTPMALITYRHNQFDGYVDSNGMAIPTVTDSTLDLSAVADIAYPMARDGRVVAMFTPRFTVRTNFHVERLDTPGAYPLLFDDSRVTLDLSGGFTLLLQGGSNFDLTVGATGILGSLQSYNARGTFTVPLN